MDEVPPYLSALISEGRVPRSRLSAQALRELQPLFAGGALTEEVAGRGALVVEQRPDILLQWAHRCFPAFAGIWEQEGDSERARSVLLRRDSKAGGAGAGMTVLHLRARGAASVARDGRDFPVASLTENHGVAACLIHSGTRLELDAPAVLIENLACFLEFEAIVPLAGIAMNSAGRISEALVQCLARSAFHGPLLHLPDYDPVGLADYLRLRAVLRERVQLHVPADIETRFASFGNKALIAQRPRNRVLLESLGSTDWPCPDSARIFRLIRESGSGLEQECLLLSPETPAI